MFPRRKLHQYIDRSVAFGLVASFRTLATVLRHDGEIEIDSSPETNARRVMKLLYTLSERLSAPGI